MKSPHKNTRFLGGFFEGVSRFLGGYPSRSGVYDGLRGALPADAVLGPVIGQQQFPGEFQRIDMLYPRRAAADGDRDGRAEPCAGRGQC